MRYGVMAVLAAGLSASGCASTPDPKLSVASAQAGARSEEGLALVFTVNAENPGPEGLPLRTVEYTVELGGKAVFRGTRSPEATLRRQGSQTLTLPAVVNLAEHPEFRGATGPLPYSIRGELKYVAPGQIAEILFDSGVRVPTVGFSDSGMVELAR